MIQLLLLIIIPLILFLIIYLTYNTVKDDSEYIKCSQETQSPCSGELCGLGTYFDMNNKKCLVKYEKDDPCNDCSLLWDVEFGKESAQVLNGLYSLSKKFIWNENNQQPTLIPIRPKSVDENIPIKINDFSYKYDKNNESYDFYDKNNDFILRMKSVCSSCRGDILDDILSDE